MTFTSWFSFTRSDGHVINGVYNGVDYFYGGTAVCYKDLWQKSTSQNYNNDCQLPRSFSHFPILPSSDESPQGLNPSNLGAHVTSNSIGRHLRDKN